MTKSTLQVIFLIGLMKLAAFFKQTVLAKYFGASTDLDIYLLAVDTLGDFSVAIFSAMSISILTLYAKYQFCNEKEKASDVVSISLKIFIPISVFCSVLFIVFSEQIAGILAMNYDVQAKKSVAYYIRITSPTIIFLCITYILVAVLDSNEKFWPGKMIGFTLSILIILSTSFFGNSLGSIVLVVAYVVAYFLHMIVVIGCCRNEIVLKNITLDYAEHIYPLISMFIPMFIGNTTLEINALVDKFLATGFGGGALAAQSYGATLNSFVVAMLITASTGVLLPYLTEYFAQDNIDKILLIIKKYILFAIAILLPISIIAIFSAEDIVRIVYQRGAFDERAVLNTKIVLTGYSVGFIFLAIREIFVKVHLANRDSKTIMINGLISITLNIALSLFLTKTVGIVGISLGTSISAVFGMILCSITMKKYLPVFSWYDLKIELLKLLVPGVIISLTLMYIMQFLINCSIYMRFGLTIFITLIFNISLLFMVKSEVLEVFYRVYIYIKNKRNSSI